MALSTQSDSKDGTAEGKLDMEIVDPCSVIEEWRSDWYCYWDGSYDMPSDPETNYVFKPPLEMSRCGVVRTRDDNWEEDSYDVKMKEYVRTIIKLFEEGKEESDFGLTIGYGDESENEW
eukprot:CAMPEP_0185742058 /NCGR_PEP_ID=MMETSP1171-20130828/39280_1 /TAXON_ID=374046 /ORGANISM="Helicotheca tamensis, Strain CCMP826" /LENGTH=118 /DNA_ID=CAMNT_0028414055 /DNA_START=295 /DNA_END=648 /DNA_ORIENTATION=-